MVFNSVVFLVFFTCVLMGYYITPQKKKWIFLLLASCFFYVYVGLKFVVFILITTITSYGAGILLDDLNHEESLIQEDKSNPNRKQLIAKIKRKKKLILVITLLINFGILFVLKYLDFFSSNINVLLNSFSLTIRVPSFNLILPLGISFYTFQTMSYIIDVYWKRISAEKNIAKLALFISFFPQIIEGPIGRFGDLAHQLYEGHEFNYQNFKFGLQLMIWGYFKKIVIADRVAVIADFVFDNYLNISGLGTAFGVFMYAIQDYTDFSGCIDIARGCAQAMGITMAENFKRPYFSRTVSEFWRRWHISLGAWMKDYVFYPFSLTKGVRKLGKYSKKKFGRHFGRTLPIALGNILVFFLVGVWHGANWNYIVWGLFYGLIIAISGLSKPCFEWMHRALKINENNKLYILFQIMRTFWITCIGCIIFRASSISTAWDILKKTSNIFSLNNNEIFNEILSFGLSKSHYIILAFSLIILFIFDVMQEKTSVRQWLAKKNIVLRWCIYITAIFIILLFGMYGPGYNQNSFVYMQF